MSSPSHRHDDRQHWPFLGQERDLENGQAGARRSLHQNATGGAESLRAHAVPDLPTLHRLADACGKVHQSYSDHVMLAALLAARGSEVAGLKVGDVDWRNRVVKIERQHYPGKGGLVLKQTKGRRARYVPILDALEPVLDRLTAGKSAEAPLLRGPRGGVLPPRPSATRPTGMTS